MSSEPMDRLSELPDSLIYYIFWLLPMTDVIRTSMLSKRWKKLWTTTPYLNFNFYTTHWPAIYIRDFVNRALLSWRGIKILKFKIDFHKGDGDGVIFFDFDVWLRFAMDKGVEELYVHVMYVDDLVSEGYDCIEEGYWLIECLYSCSSLKVLSLIGCNLNIDVKLHWDSLKSFTIKGYGLEEDLINQVLSGSPRLEVFVLRLRELGENLCIRSSCLKRLSVEKYLCYDEDEPATDTELRIWSPNLQTLEVSGVPYSKCLLMNVSSLTHAALTFKGGDLFYGNGFLGETPRQIFPTIQYVTLTGWCIKALGDMKKKELSPFPNVKYLHLDVCFEEYTKKIVDLLEIFPKLNRLVLQDETGVNSGFVQESLIFDAESNLKFEGSLPKSFLLHLRTVEATWFGGDHMIFPLLEILLKYATKLEMMTFRARQSNLMVLASQRLMRMPISSPTVKFIFREN